MSKTKCAKKNVRKSSMYADLMADCLTKSDKIQILMPDIARLRMENKSWDRVCDYLLRKGISVSEAQIRQYWCRFRNGQTPEQVFAAGHKYILILSEKILRNQLQREYDRKLMYAEEKIKGEYDSVIAELDEYLYEANQLYCSIMNEYIALRSETLTLRLRYDHADYRDIELEKYIAWELRRPGGLTIKDLIVGKVVLPLSTLGKLEEAKADYEKRINNKNIELEEAFSKISDLEQSLSSLNETISELRAQNTKKSNYVKKLKKTHAQMVELLTDWGHKAYRAILHENKCDAYIAKTLVPKIILNSYEEKFGPT